MSNDASNAAPPSTDAPATGAAPIPNEHPSTAVDRASLHEPAFSPVSPTERERLSALMSKETVGGALLVGAAILAVILANSPLAAWYEGLRETVAGVRFGDWEFSMSLSHWAADGFLAVFFFLAGLELKREFVAGDLSNPARAVVPVAAAFGGVAVPALIYFAFTAGTGLERGWAIPTATDIAFAIAVLAVVGSRLPLALRTFLLTLAVVDDLIAIVIIAVFYPSDLHFGYLLGALVPLALYALIAHRRRELFRLDRGAAWFVLLPIGLVCWGLVYLSGVHATIAGVLLGFAVPVHAAHSRGGANDPTREPGPGLAEIFEHRFRPLSAGICVPIFAFFSAGVSFAGFTDPAAAFTPVTLGIALGLVLGKPIGITLTVWLTTRVRQINLDPAIRWADVFALATVAGIGFTVSLLIAELSFPVGHPEHEGAKIAILVASTVAAFAGGALLAWRGRRHAAAGASA